MSHKTFITALTLLFIVAMMLGTIGAKNPEIAAADSSLDTSADNGTYVIVDTSQTLCYNSMDQTSCPLESRICLTVFIDTPPCNSGSTLRKETALPCAPWAIIQRIDEISEFFCSHLGMGRRKIATCIANRH